MEGSWLAENKTGKELRSSEENEFSSRCVYFNFDSQCIHPMFGKLRMRVAENL